MFFCNKISVPGTKHSIYSLTAFFIHFTRTYLMVSCLISPFYRITFHHLSLPISPLCSCKYQLSVPQFTAITCFWLRHFRYGFHITNIDGVQWYLCWKSVWNLSFICMFVCMCVCVYIYIITTTASINLYISKFMQL